MSAGGGEYGACPRCNGDLIKLASRPAIDCTNCSYSRPHRQPPETVEEVKPDLWRHKRTGGIYARIAVPMKIRGDDGSWYPAVLYRAPDGTHYARTVEGFQNAFEQHPRPEECHGQ